MILPLKDLKRALSDVAPAISSSPVVPILENILLEVKDHTVKVTGSSMQNTIIRTFETEMKNEEVKICLPFQLLNQFLGKLKELEIEIIVKVEKEKIGKNEIPKYSATVKADGNKAQIAGENPDDYVITEIDEEESKTIKLKYDDLHFIISKLLSFTSTDELKPQLRGIYLMASGKSIKAMATDGFIGALIDMEGEYENEEMEVNLRSSIQLAKNLFGESEEVQLTVYNHKYELKTEGAVFRSMLVEEKFPSDWIVSNFEKLRNSGSKLWVEKSDLLKQLDICNIFANKTQKSMRINLQSDKMEITAEDSDMDKEYNTSVKCTYSGEKLDIAFPIPPMISTIKTFDASELEIEHFNKDGQPFFIYQDNYTAMVAPLRPTAL